ncbi:UDP-glucose 4-epimerase family protein [Vibrio vulnificus]|uniref:UDP-glucose 4-epimerase family protein n=1 Tax=Vibrio vulnificus TaxID=672 RepID=UPI001A2DBC9E|nr:SDR family oxidoreductase [Vibrio vulnificus]EII3056247.1 SDR family oxidoreductase [Vibrio vulnificus]EIO3982888.1 SDR family oxidoreductase [Vibrio vulnificus]EJO3996112.1 SDR family oxidoreductase [Vibrio vulnificus]EKZ9179237.1 SDR family oxidoreductase [Vibrio vulnificus]ELG4786091.1 SDR family oxidoreductase [Vibrio vulnificus]
MSQVLVTGYTGFVGRHLLSTFEDLKNINLLGRSQPKKCSQFLKASIDSSSDYSVVLDKVSTVIHIAARVHVMNDESDDPLEEFRAVNTAGTMNLARQAAEAGVKRFIFVSSIKVNGESTTGKQAFTAQDTPSPEDPYGVSKAEAEEQLIALGKETDLEIVIIRPPLVYGEGVKANFASLMNLVSKGIPLPFGYITNNKRSLVSVDNLVDLIITCIDHPKAANQVFLVSDDYYVSTSEMVKEMAIALGKPSWQIPVPAYCYKLVGKLFDKNDVVDRLTGSLQVDISHTKETLGWTPPQTLQEGFKKTAVAFLKSKQSSGK